MVVVVVIGVCGCGKTTVGEALAKRLGCQFRDADEFHSEANKQKMSSGIPLTDEDRIPWLLAIHDCIRRSEDDHSLVLTCSALKRWYRDILHYGESAILSIAPMSSPSSATMSVPPSLPPLSPPPTLPFPTPSSVPSASSKVLFILLTGARSVLESRLAGRKGHFMNPGLLTSQLAILEQPGADENALILNIDHTVVHLVDAIVERL